MKLITRDTDYSIRALCYIAKSKGKVVSVPELTSQLRVPKPFLRSALQVLGKKGILISTKGIGGGFRLAKPAEKIFLLDLFNIFQGKFSLNDCLLKKIACPHKGACFLKKKIDRIERFALSELKGVTIASLLKHSKRS